MGDAQLICEGREWWVYEWVESGFRCNSGETNSGKGLYGLI